MPRLDFYVNYKLQASIRLDGDDVVLGRAPDCAVQMPDPRVSRHHAVISAASNTYTIENFGANGTRVNGDLIDGRRELEAGDSIFIAAYILVYRLDEIAADQLDATVMT